MTVSGDTKKHNSSGNYLNQFSYYIAMSSLSTYIRKKSVKFAYRLVQNFDSAKV